ncbi:cytidine/deoxycytidylate deaminase family protein [Myroides odoratimimus]|uniref:hypothetical protein n=1 Tax=Myroides odoratimimus TaxID=76832 RepID=UPI00046A11A5|nr:hypothetical protein [Myroides odoratimimus]
MKLKELYSLRNEFTIIGVTGKLGGGSTTFSEIISNENFISETNIEGFYLNSLNTDDIKVKMCYDYLKYPDNFTHYYKIDYWSILIFHALYESVNCADGTCENSIDISIDNFIAILCQYGNEPTYSNRFTIKDDLDEIKSLLIESKTWYTFIKQTEGEDIHSYLSKHKNNPNLFKNYKNFQEIFALKIIEKLFEINPTKRSRLFHDLGNNLRSFGTVHYLGEKSSDEFIYTVAKTINYLIKVIRAYNKKNNLKTKVVIDSLKNSLELCYFKEKFSAFYMVSINKSEEKRNEYLASKIIDETHRKEIIALGDREYEGDDFKNGELAPPDIENCIQKSEYHINFDNEQKAKRSILKLLALIERPGLITPTSIERCMQIAFNAKLNSGCISRQVGAIVTDENYVIKSLGWNDAAKGQMPCSLRSAQDLIDGKNKEIFSEFENEGIVPEENEKFKILLKEDFNLVENSSIPLQGRTCSFCFKSHLNEYEGEKNQVHTRSLHAEENAMMQIAKNGGEGLAHGILFTTASPCELCSKKSYQLGIRKIYYIDPYPGIAMTHILKSGILRPNTVSSDPKLIMFEGAIGRTFHKLYEPIMPIKDELAIIGDLKPKKEGRGLKKKVNKLLETINDDDLSKLLKDKLKSSDKDNFINFLKDQLKK